MCQRILFESFISAMIRGIRYSVQSEHGDVEISTAYQVNRAAHRPLEIHIVAGCPGYHVLISVLMINTCMH